MPTFAGGKFTGSHTTVIEPAETLIKVLNNSDLVYKISLGFIKNKAGRGGSSLARYKLQENGSGLKLVVSGAGTIQEFYIYTDNILKVKQLIQANWNSKCKKSKKKIKRR
ncbi:MAG: hypothetical protein GF365_02945 [Candidatus Buchananbacteria bacterium]|nr:hypothetical protein [Candidatus Buchananbacteria bacterium]